MPREDISLWKAQLSVRIPFLSLGRRSAKLTIALQNVVPKWTYTHVLLDTNLHIRGMNNKLIPELADYLLIASEELKYAWNIDIPACDGKSKHYKWQGRTCTDGPMFRMDYNRHPVCHSLTDLSHDGQNLHG